MDVKQRQKLLMGVSLLVTACFLGLGLYVYFEYYAARREILSEEPIVPVIDDRISPYDNQVLVLEVLRIRHRGLLETLLKPGSSWKTTPSFYFISNMDDLEYVSKDVQQHFTKKEVLFHTWDTMFQENKIMRDVVQEQETSQVTLTIVERENIGVLGLRTRDVPKDSFTVTYCYRTGRWTGDDSFGDPDGYGYYLGDTFEIWFNLYQPDIDGDFIPYWTEVNILGTDPTVDDRYTDHDGDGVSTYWEWRWGYDPRTWDDHAALDPDMDSITNSREYQLEKWFASPFIENLYVEVDHMERGGINDPPHVFLEESKQGLIERFAQHNIKAFFDNGWPNSPANGGGQVLPHIEMLSQDSGMILQFYNNYFPDERKGTFIYLVIGHGGGFQHPAKGNIYDTIQISYTPMSVAPVKLAFDFFVFGKLPTPRGIRVALGAVIMHELAHFGGINHDTFQGIDNYTFGHHRFQTKQYKETWGQYRSVMNYAVMYRPNLFDYSHGQNGPPYDQNDWANLFFGGWSRPSLRVEEPYYDALKGRREIDIEAPPITGYIFDRNLTEEYIKHRGDWSPNTRWSVEWAVYRLVEKEQYPHYRDIKVFVRPKDIANSYQSFWSLYKEGDLDSDGNVLFYCFDTLVKQKKS
jgi:hypothetical protein